MKRAFKYFAAMLAAAILCLTLVACGEKGTKYTFKEAREEGDFLGGGQVPIDVITDLYKDSYIIVENGKIEWWIMGQAQTMTYTMDGDKYVLNTKEMAEFMEQQTGGVAPTMYGQKTEEGFDIISELNTGVGYQKMVFSFTAA